MGKIFDIIRKVKVAVNNSAIVMENGNDVLAYINELGEPKDELERAHFQFLVLEKFYNAKYPLLEKIFYSFASVALMVYIPLVSVKKDVEKTKVVYYKISNNQGILPNKYLCEEDMKLVNMNEGLLIDKDVVETMKRLLKITHAPQFLFTTFYNLASYAYIVKTYDPVEIITTYESSFTASVLTYYCRLKGVKHVDFMHGEKLISFRNTFAEFDEYYVWDEHYKQMFERLQMKAKEYHISNVWNNISLPEKINSVDYCFYLNYETEEALKCIMEVAGRLNAQNIKVKVRPHPSQRDYIWEQWGGLEVLEDPNLIPIFQSIANAENCISRYSTVLFQAYTFGKKVVIDDISNKEEYERLKGMDYIMLAKPHILLSELVVSLK